MNLLNYCWICRSQSAEEFIVQYEQKTNQTLPRNLPDVSTIAYDAVWALAIALDRTANMVNTSTNTELMRSTSKCIQ